MSEVLQRALHWVGIAATPPLLAGLGRYREWLAHEAHPGGGIGPGELDRLDARHLADSVLFAGVWDATASTRVVDVGSGVGLPGIPLALALPHRHFVLLDRSGRRVRLLRRAVRVLELENVEVVQADIAGYDWRDATVVARAALPPADLLALARTQGRPYEMLVGGSHFRRPEVLGFQTVEIPAEILASPVWILRMVQ